MHVLIPMALLLLVLFGPQLWTRAVLARYARPREDFPGTGGEFARHLLDRAGLAGVRVEAAQEGDHYDPAARAVRLTPDKLGGRSLTAVVVAAHEVGHALQDQVGYRPLRLRHRLVALAGSAQRLGMGLLVGAPILMGVTRSPVAGLLLALGGLASFGSAVAVHFVTLPVELDASFNRALPLLRAGRYLPDRDLPAARRILTAAALTYVSAALASVLNFRRWWRLLAR
ncbi:MAG: zinc metallopeptidase [Gammaproteobacteria bacterium]|nr:zinc metallopeptidase [Gammaproteobacteria bacterium]